jgi:orotidine-5'-phosphate decarboxylase
MTTSNPILVALDVPDAAQAMVLVQDLAPVVGGFKVGLELFVHAGPGLVRRIRETGARVFLDLKFHDIPNTVSRAVAAAVRLDVQWLTVHTSGGAAMMTAAVQSAFQTAHDLKVPSPLILGVTVLTSLDDKSLEELGWEPPVNRQVERLARLAVTSGLKGLVCSPLEVAALRQILPEDIQLVTPGIRAAEDRGSDDQKRILTARQAINAGADWLVIGRPICAAKYPRAAAEQILASLSPTETNL